MRAIVQTQGFRRAGRRTSAALVLLTASALGMAALAGEIYRSLDEDGNPVFTDQPPEEGAQPEALGDIIVVQPPPRSERRDAERHQASRDRSGDSDETVSYAGIRIVFPPADEATRRVTGEVPVRVELEPAGVELAEGHRVRIYVDGEAEGEAPATEVMVGPLNPGPRYLRAAVIDRDGWTRVESAEMKFYLLRQTVNN